MRTSAVAIACIVAAGASSIANAFVGSAPMRASTMPRPRGLKMASETASVPSLLKKTEELKLLSTASKLGLLSKLEAAGLSLKDVEKLLPLVDTNDLIGLAKGAAPDLLKVAPAALAFAPGALPLLASALVVPAEALYVAALASFGAGAALVYVLPDDTLVGVALETFLAIPLLFVIPSVCVGGGLVLSSLKNGSLVNYLASSAISVGDSLFPGDSPISNAVKGKGGRPTATGLGKKAAQAVKKAAPKSAGPKKYAPVKASKPTPAGNIANLPKAL